MNALLSRLFRLEPGEQGRVLAFMLLGGVLQAGLAIGQSAADSLFLVHIGANRLPVIYVAMPALMALYIPAYSFLLSRYGVNRVFEFTLGLLIAGGLAFYFTLTHFAGAPAYYAVKLYGSLWYVGLYTLFWNFVDGYFDLTKAKRLFGLLAAGPAAGAIFGGAFVNEFAKRIGVPALFLAWAVLALAAWPLLRRIRRKHQLLLADAPTTETRPAVRDTLRQIVGSRFVTVLIAVLFITLITATVCEYQYLRIFSAAADENTLAELFGELFAGVNVFNLCISLFFFNTLVLRIGVRNTALIQPTAYLVVFALLLIHDGFGAGLLGFLAYQGIMTSIDFNNVNLLFNGLPEEGRAQVRTFIEGLCEPLATATAGVFLFFLAPRLAPENLSAIGFICALFLLILGFVLRADYARSMVANVRRSWLDFTRAAELLATIPSSEVPLLEQRVAQPVAGERLTALRLLCVTAPLRGLERVLAFLAGAPPDEREEAQPLISGMLENRDPRVLLESMRWSERHIETLDSFLLEELGRHRLVPAEVAADRLSASDPTQRAAAAALLWRSSRLPHGRAALLAVDDLLHAGDGATLAGIRGLGRMGEPRYVPHLLLHLQSEDPKVRIEVLRALLELANRDSTRLVPVLLRLLAAGGSFAERQLILELLGRIADSSSLPQLLALAGRFSPHERRMTEQLVIQFGPRAVPALINMVQNLDAPMFSRLIAVRALGRLAFPQLEAIAPALIESLVVRSYGFAAHSLALSAVRDPSPGLATLILVYRLLPQLALEMILEILSTTGRLPGYDSIVTALRSGSARDRAYAIENIEQGCTRRLFTQIQPFLDGRPVEAVVKAGHLFGFTTKSTIDTTIDRSLRVRFPFEAAAALQALRETRPGEAAQAALAALRQDPDPLLRGTALILLARDASNADDQMTPVERICLLSQADFFREWGVRELEFVGRNLREFEFSAGAVMNGTGTAGGLHVVVRGSFSLLAGSDRRYRGVGSTLNEQSLFGRGARCLPALAEEDAATLFVPAGDILTCARIYPQIALELLRRKLTSRAI